jgi:hypothetical protein
MRKVEKNLFKKIIFLSLIISFITFAQSENDSWNFSGHVQLRSELDWRDFNNKTHPLTFASLRTRVGVEKNVFDKLNFFVQLQDSRIFGQEPGTLANTANIDLHQGYVILKQLFDWNLDVQAGRLEVVYGTERFFGAVGWHYIGRAWDGVRLSLKTNVQLDLFALTQSESVSYIGNATPGVYPNPSEPTPSVSLYGLWGTKQVNQNNRLDIFGYAEFDRNKNSVGVINLSRYTVGLNHYGKFGIVNSVVEAAYQFGKISGRDISAYLVSLQGNVTKDIWNFGVGADLISGTDMTGSNDKYNSFNPSFGTNHKFYGYMDYFINVPNNTIGLGLNDFYANIAVQPAQSKFSAGVNFHYFMSNQSFPKTTVYGPGITEISSLGQEVDITVKYNFIKGTTITWGGSFFIPGELMRIIFGNNDAAFWSYIMITANI